MTTDTHPKQAAVRVEAGGRTYTVGGVAKGSGMIHPDMATMFGFLTTDAPADYAWLQATLRRVCDRSFNMIDVDMDTSTSDTVLLLANGAAGGEPVGDGHPAADALERAIDSVSVTLARQLARDGEGANTLIEVLVEGAASIGDARLCARTISSSPLVKTMVTGRDPNWGRVLMAAGRSGAAIDPTAASVWIGEHIAFERGTPAATSEAGDLRRHGRRGSLDPHRPRLGRRDRNGVGMRPDGRVREHQRGLHNMSTAPMTGAITSDRMIVVKIGGSTLGDEDTTLVDVVALRRNGMYPIVVHGGGAMITDWLERLEVPAVFVDGLRATSEEALEVVIGVLRGVVNTRLVTEIVRLGGRAVGVSGVDGGLVRARRADERLGFVGEITGIDASVLHPILEMRRDPGDRPHRAGAAESAAQHQRRHGRWRGRARAARAVAGVHDRRRWRPRRRRRTHRHAQRRAGLDAARGGHAGRRNAAEDRRQPARRRGAGARACGAGPFAAYTGANRSGRTARHTD